MAESAQKTSGLDRTFAALAKSAAPEARRMLLAGLDETDVSVQSAAALAILRQPVRREDIAPLIAVSHRVAPEIAGELSRRIDEIIYPVREALASGAAETRANAVDIIRRSGRAKFAYLLVRAAADTDAEVSSRALDGLRRMVESFQRSADAARLGGGDVGRAELEARKFALLDPLLAHLGNLALPQPDELLMLAMGLDARANEMIFNILDSRQDPRIERVTRILWNSNSPAVVSFLFDALRDRRVSSLAASVIRMRRDLPFVRSLLMCHRFFTDYRVRESLRKIESTEFLCASTDVDLPISPRKDVFTSALSALRAVHFVMLSGVPATQKVAFIQRVAVSHLPVFVSGIAENVLKAMHTGRSADEISAALAHLEREMGVRAGLAADEKKVRGGFFVDSPELELPWAHPDAQSLPEDAFTQFFNTFDSLDEATKMLCAQTLKRLDPAHVEEMRKELASLDGDRRLKAVKIVVALHREQALEEPLLALASDPDRRVRATVVKTLGLLEDEPAIRRLLEVVSDPDRRVVANSVEAIEAVGREELLGLVRILASHPNNRIRANAVKALWTMGDRSAGQRLDDMLRSTDEMMRLSATWLLGEIDHARRIEMLTTIAKTDPSDRVRAKASAILGES